jgi:4-aminobutyrate aminotransferase-like enzyme
MNSWQQPTAFEQYVNPVVGERTRRIGLDKQYVRGDGCHLFDQQGRAYLDFLGLTAHCRSAMARQS